MRLSIALLLALPFWSAAADAPRIDKAWYTPPELLALLGEQAQVRWAMPETLAGRAFLGGDAKDTDALLEEACRQWGLAWTRNNGIVVVHKPGDDRLQKCTDTVRRGGKEGQEAAWELGWLRDARALPVLAEALADKDAGLALAAAHAIETLDRFVPVGRADRVDPLPAGRVPLAAAFPTKVELLPLLASPFPSVRAAALRLAFAQGGNLAEQAKLKTASDRSVAVRCVRQQFLFVPPADAKPEKLKALLPAPAAAEVKNACAKLLGELPALEKQSAWEEMRWRVRTMAVWSRQGHQPATDALIELTETKLQAGWFPGYAQQFLAGTGSEQATTKLKTMFAKADRATLSRGLEQGLHGNALLAFTRPYLSEQTICYVTARKAGREAYDELLALAGRGNYAAIDTLGAIGGPQAVPVLRGLLEKDAGTQAFRAAKALGQVGTLEALAALQAASRSDVRARRHAAALALGRIGGPEALARLKEIVQNDADRLVRAAAADALEQIGVEEALAAAAGFRKADKAEVALAYQPRNPRFGADFPVNEWVNLKIKIDVFAEFGEMGWNYDAANRLFFRYGGCSGYTNELTVFDLGTEQFTQRRPNEEMAGWGDRRPPRGCSAGRAWDPRQRLAWIGPSIGGSEADLAIAEYYNKDGDFRFCSYDLASDRFRAAPQPRYATRYVIDDKTGLLFPIAFTHPNHKTKDFWAFDVNELKWLDKKDPQGEYPRDSAYTTAAMDRASGLLVVYICPTQERAAQTWTYDPAANVWKERSPKVQPAGVAGAGFAYDPFHKVLLLQSGTTATQFGGGADSITWTYDVGANTWTDLAPKSGPGNPWVGAMDFDPEHNVFVLFNHKDKQVWAYRYRALKQP